MNSQPTNGKFDPAVYFGLGFDKEIKERNGIQYIFNLVQNKWTELEADFPSMYIDEEEDEIF